MFPLGASEIWASSPRFPLPQHLSRSPHRDSWGPIMGQAPLWAPREQQGKAGEFWELLPELTARKRSRRTCHARARVFWAGSAARVDGEGGPGTLCAG